MMESGTLDSEIKEISKGWIEGFGKMAREDIIFENGKHIYFL